MQRLRDEKPRSAAEFYHADTLSPCELVSLRNGAYDSPRYDTGNLHDGDFAPAARFDDDGIVFVFISRGRAQGVEKLSLAVF